MARQLLVVAMIVVAVVALLSAVPMVASSPSCLDENGRPFKADGKIAVVVRIMVKVPTLSMSSDPNAASEPHAEAHRQAAGYEQARGAGWHPGAGVRCVPVQARLAPLQ
ncbi:uncharacterized protein ACA1_041930, partial [Acanthamoeba castellanii str. Neff]